MSLIALMIVYGIIASIVVIIIAYIQVSSAVRRVNKAKTRLNEIINELPYKKKKRS